MDDDEVKNPPGRPSSGGVNLNISRSGRGQGRPRKDVAAKKENGSADDVATAPKKRGRKPGSGANKPKPAAGGTGRGRGRPPKNAAAKKDEKNDEKDEDLDDEEDEEKHKDDDDEEEEDNVSNKDDKEEEVDKNNDNDAEQVDSD